MWFLRFAVIFAVAGYLLSPTPEAPSSKKPSLNDFDFTTNSQTRVVPEAFGTTKMSGNLIYAGELRSKEITQDAGSKKSGDVVVGYENHLTFALGFCSKLNGIKRIYLNNTKVADWSKEANKGINEWKEANGIKYYWNSYQTYLYPIEHNTYTNFNGRIATRIPLKTGKNATILGSGYGKNTVYAYNGEHQLRELSNPNYDFELRNLTGKNIVYKDLSYIFFDDVFIGDNATTLPDYKIIGVSLINRHDMHHFVSSDILDIRRYYIINHIFTKYINGQTIATEIPMRDFPGLSFLMTSERTAQKWIQEILRHIDGILYYSINDSSYKLTMIREGRLSVLDIDESKYRDLKFIRKSYKEVKNKITLKYTHPDTLEETSIIWNNEARQIQGSKEVSGTYEFMMCRNHDYAKEILNRLIKKEGYPIARLKFKLSANDVNEESGGRLNPGDVINFSSERLGVSNMKIRILSIEGGKEEELEYDIEAVEDIYNIREFDDYDFEHNEEEDADYSLNDLSSEILAVYDTPAEMTNSDAMTPIIVDTSEETVNGYNVQDGATGNKITISENWSYAGLQNTYIITDELDYNTVLTLEYTKNMKRINGSEIDFQRTKYFGIFENGEMFAFRDIVDNGDGTFNLSHIIRGLANSGITQHNRGSKIYLNLNGNTANKLKSLNIIPASSKIAYFNKFNNFFVSDKVAKNYIYNYTMRKPYNPANVKYERDGTNVTFNWSRCVRLSGANYRSRDIIVAGEDEGVIEDGLVYIIDDNVGNIYETVEDNITITLPINSTIFIYSKLNGFESSKELIRIP